ncbi:VOC family protein [Sphingosinithalassobacter portus]|uniref:VOC family protein n=1 Tax=Stakelama portus TaxID=2676234 RepID=UPI000D6DCE72|nr:VOC family protein [Sphingosinithalassobacter portus]
MPDIFIEHVNITVRDAERSAMLMEQLFDWKVRWQGPALNDGHSVHVGDDRFYLALYSPPETPDADSFVKGRPLNHIGICVDDLDSIEQRVIDAGLIPFNHAEYAPGRRFYFLDPDGTEFEIVSYS